MGEIVVFSKSNCHHCSDAKSLLSELHIPFTDIDIEADIQNSMLMSLASKRHTVPQIFFNDYHIGGDDFGIRCAKFNRPLPVPGQVLLKNTVRNGLHNLANHALVSFWDAFWGRG